MIRAPVLLFLLLAAGAYYPALSGGFVYDDHRFVVQNEALRTLTHPERFLLDPTTVDPQGGWEGIYRPLRTWSYALDRALWGTNPWGYHLHNLLLHVLTALALACFAAPYLGGRRGGTRLALLYLLHPVHVESVAWITSRADVQVGWLGVTTLLCWQRRRFRLGHLALALALLAKEPAVVLPCVGVLLARPADRRVGRWLPAFCLAAAYLVLRAAVLGVHAGQRPDWLGGTRLATAGLAGWGCLWYLGRLLLPVGFRFDYQLQNAGLPPAPGLALLALVGVLGVWAVRRAWRRPGEGRSAGTVLALAAWLPTANLLVPLNILVAERFLYLPAAGVLLAGATLLRRRRGGGGAVLVAAAVLWGLFLGVETWRTSRRWRDEEALWRAVAAAAPEHFRAYHGLAKACILRGERREARRFLREALRRGGGEVPEIYFDLGRTFLPAAPARAVPYLQRAVELWRARGAGAKDRAYCETLRYLRDYYRAVGDLGAAARMGRWLAAAGAPP